MRAVGRLTVIPTVLSCLLAATPTAAADNPLDVQQRHAAELHNRGVIEAQAGRFESGAEYLRQALAIDPHDAQTRSNLSGILADWASRLVQEGDVDQAERLLREAVKHKPDNGMALVRLGDLYYFHRSEFDAAIALWKRANGHVSTDVWHAVAHRLTQAERDRRIERTFSVSRTSHFDIRVQSPNHPAVTTLGQLLEQEYAGLLEKLGRGPSKITVIVYTARDLKRLYNQRDWFIGFYDGRLRLRWNELATGNIRAIVAHELAHAFLHHVYGPYLPNWVHEGFAQLNEGTRRQADEEQRIEEGIEARTMWIPLAWIDRRFSQPSGTEDVQRAYVESRMVVDELVTRYGVDRFKAFLAHLSRGVVVETAFDKAFSPSRWVRANHGVFD